jgi:hypothetical protein
MVKRITLHIFLHLVFITMFVNASAQGTLVDFNSIPKSGTALVMAHMDDELIWMLPWWRKVEKFVEGAMPSDPRFLTIVDQAQDYIDSKGYGIQYKPNWVWPWGQVTNKEYSDYYWDNLSGAQYLAVDHLIAYWDNNDDQLVRTEVNRIKAKIEQYIATPAVSRIVTHNNWGEYGHQHHRAVNKAVRELAVKYRKDVWMLGCDNGDFVDVDIPAGITYAMGDYTQDTALYWAVKTIYDNNWCWTWYDDIPTGSHEYIKIVEGGVDKSTILTGEDVTVSGPTQNVPGAYIFDGVDDYMTVVGKNSASFTIAMQVRPDVIRNMDISKMTEYPGNPTSDRNFYMNSNGTISARIYDGSDKVVTSTSSLAANTWAHVAMAGNGSSLTIYINGLPEGTISAGSAITSYTSPEFVMGQLGMTSAFFDGQLSDVQLFDRALSAAEIAALSGVKYTITATAGTGGNISPSGTISEVVGSTPTFIITPDSPYILADVRVDNVSVGAVPTYTFTAVKANHTISATFLPKITHTITVTPNANGTISPSGSVAVAEGTSQTFTITGNTGFQVADVLVDGSSVGAVSSYTFNNVLTDHSISASYTTVQTYTITASAGSGGTISPSGSVLVNQGANQTFTISPNTGFKISAVTVDGASVGALTSYTFSNVTAGHTISATFTTIPTYTITASAGSGGTISPSGSVSVSEGGGSTFTITPNTGYVISNVLVDNVSVGAVPSYSFTNVTSAHTISATFSVITFTITATYGSGGTISPNGAVSVNYGSNRSFTITPNSGYSVSAVTVDGSSAGAVTSYTFTNVTANHTINVTFSTQSYNITASAGAGGSISPSGAVAVNYGSNQSFTVTPSTGYHISDVKADNVSVGAVSAYTFSNVTAAHTIAATFAINTYTLTATAGSGGSISPAGSTTVNYGASQSYTITPNTGYNISDVLVDGVSVGAVSTYSFTGVSAVHTISATFGLNTFTITASAATGGTISPSGAVTVTYGGNKTFNITPSTGYRISDVKIDNSSVGAVSTYTFTNVTGAHTISATFVLLTYTITGSSGTGGTLSPSGTITVVHGTNQTYTVTPSTGYSISDVTVDGSAVGPVSSYTFSSISGSHSISAEFELLSFTLTASAGEGGEIDPSGDIYRDYGTSKTFTIIPGEGYNIADVKVDDISVGAVDSYTFADISADHTISASFVLKTFTITVDAGTNGSVEPGGPATVDYGSSKTFDIKPADGYKVGDVLVDGVSVGVVSSYTFENITEDHSISAAFQFINIYTIAASAGIGGSISPSGTISLPEESTQSYTISPDIGFRVLRVVVDNTDKGMLSEYTFSSIESDHVIEVEFTSETNVSVYPSPFTDEFKVKIETPLTGNFDLFVYDVASRIVYTQNNVDPGSITEVNLQSAPRGVYFVRLFHKGTVMSTVKVIRM